MLRLVHPPPGGNGGDPPSRRKGVHAPALALTPDEARAVRATLRNVARAYGGVEVLRNVLGVSGATMGFRRRPSAGLAVALARVSGASVDAVLGRSAILTEAGRCRSCGSRIASGRAAGGAR